MDMLNVNAGAPAPADNAPAPESKAPEPVKVEVVEPQRPSLDDDLLAVYNKLHQPRDDSGKFAGKEPPAAEDTNTDKPAETAEATKEPKADQPEEKAPETAKPSIEAPISWSAEHKAKWASVPPELQGYIAQREADAHKAITRAGEQSRQYEERIKASEPIEQVVQSFKDDIARRGMQPAQAFAALLNAQRMLDANPMDGITRIALGYGIDLRPALQVLAGQQPQFGQPVADPRVAQLEERNRHLEQRLAQHESKMSEWETAAVTKRQTEAETIIASFAKDKPDFAALEADLLLLIPSIREAEPNLPQLQVLEKAYDRARWANPDTRAKLIESQQKEAEARRQDEARKKAEEARKSDKVNVRSAPINSQNPKTVDDTLAEVAAKHFPGYAPRRVA